MGHGGIVKLLLERGDITPDTADKEGRTPLSWAAETGREGITNMLLEPGDITPDTVDKNGRTPLLWAKEDGHAIVVQMLQERCRVSQNMVMTNPTGLTPLSPASARHHSRAPKRRLGNQGSVPQSGATSNSIGLSPAKPSSSSQRHSKKARRS